MTITSLARINGESQPEFSRLRNSVQLEMFHGVHRCPKTRVSGRRYVITDSPASLEGDQINIPVDEIEKSAPNELQDKNKEIIVYCASTECQASPRAAKKLEELGYSNVTDYEAGVAGWQDAGYQFEGNAV